MTDITRQLNTEINIINATLAAFNLDAGTRPAWTTIAGSSYILYGLRTGQAQRIDAIEQRLPELAERISAARQHPTPVRLRRLPLALEIAHPNPAPLPWRNARLKLPWLTMLTGRVYAADSAHDDTICLRQHPHILIAGATGSGKSTLARMMLLSLAINTSPHDLELVIVDMKNTDLAPLATLPHVSRCAVLDADAARTVRYVESILRQRIERQITEPKLLLAIDELRELTRLPGIIDTLGSIISLGRSLGVHVLAATQHPKASEIGSVVKANFPVRIIGQVVGARHAEAAADRPNTGAELLPGAGAFLRIDGPAITRLQAYYIDAAGMTALIDLAQRTYAAPVRTGAPTPAAPPAPAQIADPAPVRTSATGAHSAPPPVQFPIPRRAPTAAEAAAIQAIRQELGSLNQTILAVYGSKSSDTHRWVSEALAAPPAPPQPPQAPILRMAGGAR